MKLIRWVEVHIGRSRRKTKKDKDGIEGKLTINCGADFPRRHDESTPNTPLRKIEPLGKDLPAPLSAGSTPQRRPRGSIKAPDTPSLGSNRRSLHIRTSFLDAAAVPESPRQRSRIRTNPWLPSPRSSIGGAADCGWIPPGPGGMGPGGNRTSSVGSESSESIAGSGFGSQSSGSFWEGLSGDSWNAAFRCGRSPSVVRLPRVTLERTSRRQRTVDPDQISFGDEDRPYCPVSYCRPIPRTSWMDFSKISNDDNADESSDEAYSEDYVHSEDHDGADPSPSPPPQLPLDGVSDKDSHPKDTGSPQADSACGSDRDNSSCSTTPLSELGPPSEESERPLSDSKELLQDKVQRLRLERHLVDERIQEARQEEILRREEQLILQRELVQFRRLLLLQTLTELRDQLERQDKRLHRAYSSNIDNSRDDADKNWQEVQTDII